MLRTASPNISIITNFGCRANCWYCIWKGHELQYTNQPTDWDKLYRFLTYHEGKGKVSISGGGDCLYKYDQYARWWKRLFELTTSLGMLVDVHSREKFRYNMFWKKINRCAFSSDVLSEDIEYLKYLCQLTNVRITHLVTANTTFELIDSYLEFQIKSGCQLTIKELVGHSDDGMYQKIRAKYPEIYNLDKGDYNIYYMPDNSIRSSFL